MKHRRQSIRAAGYLGKPLFLLAVAALAAAVLAYGAERSIAAGASGLAAQPRSGREVKGRTCSTSFAIGAFSMCCRRCC